MITSEHDDLNARFLAVPDRARDGGLNRIADADEAERSELMGVVDCFGGASFGDEEHAQASLPQSLGGRQHLVSTCFVNYLILTISSRMGTPQYERLRRAFCAQTPIGRRC